MPSITTYPISHDIVTPLLMESLIPWDTDSGRRPTPPNLLRIKGNLFPFVISIKTIICMQMKVRMPKQEFAVETEVDTRNLFS